jgi:hypothetical protein
MLAVLGLGLVQLRVGLSLRRARLLRRERDSRRHRRLGRVFLVALVIGYASGLGSLGGLRGEPLFASFHFLLTSGALSSVTAAYVLGRRLERAGTARVRRVHVICGSTGLLLGLAAAAAGLAILP